jgi:hypothetical protein
MRLSENVSTKFEACAIRNVATSSEKSWKIDKKFGRFGWSAGRRIAGVG